MKIEKIIVKEPESEWVIKFGGNIGLLMEHNEQGNFISMTTEVDHLDSGFLRAMAKQIEAIAFMADDLDEELHDDVGDGYTNIFIEITDGAMYELLQEYTENEWTLKVGDYVIFRFKGFGSSEFDPIIPPKYDGERTKVTGQETATKIGEMDFEYYNVKFDDGFELQGISGYHLQDKI